MKRKKLTKKDFKEFANQLHTLNTEIRDSFKTMDGIIATLKEETRCQK